MNLDELESQVRALIDQDQKIEAIKLVRRTTSWGLRESKEYVDALARAALPALSPADEAALEQKVRALVQQDRYAGVIKRKYTAIVRPVVETDAAVVSLVMESVPAPTAETH